MVTGLKLKSIITRPQSAETLAAGAIVILGTAHAGEADVERVDISTDSGATWRPAEFTTNLATMVSLLSALFVIATILGFLLDGIHHFMFKKRESTLNNEMYKYLTTAERMALVRHFLDDDYWYPYEAYANIFIAMLPGIIIIPCGLLRLQTNLIFTGVVYFLFIAILYIIFVEARDTLDQYKDVESNLIEGFKNDGKKPPNQAMEPT